jgi:hypothetical protein
MKFYYSLDSIPELATLSADERLKAHASCKAQLARDRIYLTSGNKRTERLLGALMVLAATAPFITATLLGLENPEFIALLVGISAFALIGLVFHQLQIRLMRRYYAQYLQNRNH